jgi:hypothetical protein
MTPFPPKHITEERIAAAKAAFLQLNSGDSEVVIHWKNKLKLWWTTSPYHRPVTITKLSFQPSLRGINVYWDREYLTTAKDWEEVKDILMFEETQGTGWLYQLCVGKGPFVTALRKPPASAPQLQQASSSKMDLDDLFGDDP